MKAKKIIYCTADWCSACKAMKPNFEKVMSNLPDIKYEYIDVESDRGYELSLIYGIKNLPTLIFLDEKTNVIGKETGNTAFREIDKYL